ncbi:MAG: ATP synthase F1 subunit gamma, partial [Defluviitaleaceae bacterium]|nr:ATP synthase F1 subunit gamma [Defluviitaleaceae bacterium]
MSSIKAIKQRRNVVLNMKQAMKAMNLVSTAKLRKSKERWGNTLPFLEGTDKIMMDAAKSPATACNMYVKEREVRHKNTGYIVFTSDRGKCGSYNINICKAVLAHASAHGKNAILLPIGGRGVDYFLSQSQNIHRHLGAMPENPTFEDAEAMGTLVLEDFCLNSDDEDALATIDELYIAYTRYHTVLNLEPTIKPILPISLRLESDEANNTEPPEMEYDPDVDSFLGYMAPMYLNTQIYGAMLEAALCEQAARMVATDTAVNNAEELAENLTLQYNRQRQGIIT